LLFFLNLAKTIGFPGLIYAPLKYDFNLNFLIIFGIKSYFPAETAPEVIIISLSDLRFLIISFSNTFE